MTDKKTPFDKHLSNQETPFDQYISEGSKGMPLTAMAGESFVNSLLAAPSGSGDFLAFLAGGAEGLGHGLIPGGEGFEFGRRIEEQQGKFPANALRMLPRPEIGEIGAGVRSLPSLMPGGETFTESYGADLAEQDAARRITEKESPIKSQMAQFGGEGLAITAGRMPFTSKISKLEDWVTTVNKPDLFFGVDRMAKAPTTVRGAVANALKTSKFIRGLGRGAIRAGEAGLEATALDIINGNDPGEMFGYAAGLQAGESALLAGGKAVFGGTAQAKATKLTATLIVGAALWQQLQIATPMDDNFLDALNVSGEKILLGLATGAAAAMAGGGRLRGSTDDMSKTAQTIIDGLTAVPRAEVIGFIRQANDASPEGQQAISALMNGVLMNPDALTPGELQRVYSAQKNGTLEDTAVVMMRDKRFVERISKEPYQPDFSSFSEIPFEKPIR